MGICGSGAASIALIAHEQGFRVSGCDLSVDSYYASELKKRGIPIYEGHSEQHIANDVDVVAVSPAIFDISPDNPEVKEADRRGILMTWQEFMGKYLQKDKRVIAVSGTHGKTTTTFLTAEILIDGKLDPTVEGGSVYKKWKSGGRIGRSDLFLCEADEFNRNFFHYKPETAVITNVEMDHPECFRDVDEVIDAFSWFLKNDPNLKHLVISGDSPGAVEVLKKALESETVRKAEITVVFRNEKKFLPVSGVKLKTAVYRILKKEGEESRFSVNDGESVSEFLCRMPGEYNVTNAVMAILTARIYGVSDEVTNESLAAFSGAGRRFDLVGMMGRIPVYDDYAHHPTEIEALLSMCREYYPGKRILAVFEPHQVSRLRLMFQRYVDALTIADYVVIAKTHIGREVLKNVVPLSGREWEAASEKIRYEEDVKLQKAYAAHLADAGKIDMILVIGAANSYKISRYFIGEE